MPSSNWAAGGRQGSRRRGIGEWLCLAATPVFATMAFLTTIGGSADMMCSAVGGAFSLNGMATMYLLMSVFHMPPWLRLMFGHAGRFDS
ncbi:hypothetical protein LMIY3S_02066 [Labrys miyagiensis]